MIANGIEYDDADLELFADGSVHDATLTRDAHIQGVPCAGGRSVVFWPSGRLKIAWLSEATALGKVPCAAGVTFFHDNGCVLNARLATECRELPAGTRCTFDDTGELLEYDTRLATDERVNGVPCASAFRVWRYASGALSRFVLSEPHTFGGRTFDRGSELTLDEAGAVIEHAVADLDSGRQYMQRVFGAHEADIE